MNFRGLSDGQIRESIEALVKNKETAKKRTLYAESDIGKAFIADLKDELKVVRTYYKSIPMGRHTNIIATDLAKLIGREEELLLQLKKWNNAKNVYKSVDTDIGLCEKELVDRKNQNKTRSIKQ